MRKFNDMVAQRIKQIAKERGMKMSDIANALGINPVNFSASINGNPTVHTLEKIAEVLNVTISDFFEKPDSEVTGYLEVKGEIKKISNRSDILRILEILDK